MNTVGDPYQVRAVETVETVEGSEALAIITTTLYDLITAIQDTVEPGEEGLVVPTILYMLSVSRATWASDVSGLDL